MESKRQKDYSQLRNDLLQTLHELYGFHPMTDCKITGQGITFFLKDPTSEKGKRMFGSEVEANVLNYSGEVTGSIDMGSTGAFDRGDTAPLWRTKHAMLIIENWDAFFSEDGFPKYCKKYLEIVSE